jgi:hypothetical protein
MLEPALDEMRFPRFEAILKAFSPEAQTAIRALDCGQRFTKDEIVDRTAASPINTDHSPVTEYYLGSALSKFMRSNPGPIAD